MLHLTRAMEKGWGPALQRWLDTPSRAIQMPCLDVHGGEPEESSGKQTHESPWVGGCTWEDQTGRARPLAHR